MCYFHRCVSSENGCTRLNINQSKVGVKIKVLQDIHMRCTLHAFCTLIIHYSVYWPLLFIFSYVCTCCYWNIWNAYIIYIHTYNLMHIYKNHFNRYHKWIEGGLLRRGGGRFENLFNSFNGSVSLCTLTNRKIKRKGIRGNWKCIGHV